MKGKEGGLLFEIEIGWNFELRMGDLGEDCCLSLCMCALVFLLTTEPELIHGVLIAMDTSVMDTGEFFVRKLF